MYDKTAKSERVLAADNGAKGPLRWLGSDTVLYRLSTSRETSDYAVSIVGGAAKKVSNVTDSLGIERWSY